MRIPVTLAFFVTGLNRSTHIIYPSAGGMIQTEMTDVWESLVADHPVLCTIRPEVEALLINRISTPADYFIAPVDECFRLVGTVRENWRDLSGGPRVWAEIEAFFTRLRARAVPEPAGAAGVCP